MKFSTASLLYIILLVSLSSTSNLMSITWEDIKLFFSNPLKYSENKSKKEQLTQEQKDLEEQRKRNEEKIKKFEKEREEAFELFSNPTKYEAFKKSKQSKIDGLQERTDVLKTEGKNVDEIQKGLTNFLENSLTRYLSGLDVNYNAYRLKLETNESDPIAMKLFAKYIELGAEHIDNFNELAKTLEEKIKALEK